MIQEFINAAQTEVDNHSIYVWGGSGQLCCEVSEDVNANAVCGNQGGTTGDGSTRINNLLMYVHHPSDIDFNVRFGTIPIK